MALKSLGARRRRQSGCDALCLRLCSAEGESEAISLRGDFCHGDQLHISLSPKTRLETAAERRYLLNNESTKKSLRLTSWFFSFFLILPFRRPSLGSRRRRGGGHGEMLPLILQGPLRRRLLAPERARGSLASTPGRSTSWANRVVLVLPFASCGET